MRAAAIAFAALMGFIVIVAAVSAMYDQCGPLCWQGMRQALRDRY